MKYEFEHERKSKENSELLVIFLLKKMEIKIIMLPNF